MDPRLAFGSVLILQGIYWMLVLGVISAGRKKRWWLAAIYGLGAVGSFLVMWWLIAESIRGFGQDVSQ